MALAMAVPNDVSGDSTSPQEKQKLDHIAFIEHDAIPL